ncbi:hypothetical protein U1839_02420 [Sphingomonas sp. RT2P30]|uniref:hypothetical protein n=1 Tax=Parasphingomonas halimpatiens TaxID=3096162 RepID=UPI002FC913BD
MKAIAALAVILPSCLVPSAAIASQGNLAAVVRALGAGSTRADYALLERHRCSAPAQLVDQLEEVPPQTIMSADQARQPRTMHVIEVLAALRFLTGNDFFGPIDPEYVSDGGQFLTADLPPQRSRFYAIWMSRQTIYVAPVRTQRSIIKQWRIFVAKQWNCRKPASLWRKDDRFFRYGDKLR